MNFTNSTPDIDRVPDKSYIRFSVPNSKEGFTRRLFKSVVASKPAKRSKLKYQGSSAS